VKSVSIIGAGRIGGAIALGLPRDGYRVTRLLYRTGSTRAEEIASRIGGAETGRLDGTAALDTDLIVITTQDGEIGSAAHWLAQHLVGRPLVFHTSGALSSRVLSELADKGCPTGSIHPLVSVSDPVSGVEGFKGSYFCIEGNPEALRESEEIVSALGGMPFTIDTQYKTLYHASAVTACGHLVALFDAAVEMMTKCGLDEAGAKKILLPLVNSTVRNLNERSTADALTGTFARADVETFVRHLQALNNVSEDLLEIYLLLGERSLELASKQGANAEKVETLRAKVAIAKTKLKW
jgi:predicted short-subunit dehydrogenase-like oxidoreductase (DUF2520 family)